ncbi:MAG: succinate dehydrogenase assembly factor 2 [Sphingomonadales bacterium]|jgi:antitoxin CptB
MTKIDEDRLRRLSFRAWHRGTKETDIILGSFVDSRIEILSAEDVTWLERLMEEEDVSILSWIIGKEDLPDIFDTPLMAEMQKLDYLNKTKP